MKPLTIKLYELKALVRTTLISAFMLFNLIYAFSQENLTHDVYFDTDKYELPQTEESRLFLFISKLTDVKIKSITIYGFCDDRGTESYNLDLSKKRAIAIKDFFASNEIDEKLITNTNGKGEVLLKIVDEKDISKIRGLNRKVEININPKTADDIRLEALSVEERESAIEKLKLDLKKGDKIVLDKIYFKSGYTIMNPESFKTLTKIAEILKKRDDIYFTIQGHVCCTHGAGDAIDMKTKLKNLSEARAKYIYEYFASRGISKKRMKYVGLRRLFPLGGEPEFDRRVEILITYSGGKPYSEVEVDTEN